MNQSPLRNILVVAKREFSAYFTSPVAYVFLVIFLLLAGFFTFMVGQDFFSRNEASLGSFFLWHPWLYLFLVPAIAMRLWSEEKRTGTLELLLTLPITTGQAVIGKFLASWAFLILCLILTFPIWITPVYLGDPDNGAILCAYFGSALMAGAYLGIGCMTSAITRNQVISFVMSVVLCLFTILAGFPPVTDFIQGLFPDNEAIVGLVANMSVMTHFDALQRGVFHLKDALFFVSLIIVTLVATTAIIRAGQENKPSQAIGITGAQVAILFAALILVNGFAYTTRAKVDFTEDKIHTLSLGTKNILKRVAAERGEDPDAFKIEARLYFTRGEDRVTVFVRQYAERVSELLKEYQEASSGSLVFNEINPQPDTDEEELAQNDNVTRMQIGLDEYAYLGLTLSYADRTEIINLLEQGPGGRPGGLRPESLLEYDISGAITRLIKDNDEAPTIGVMSPLQLTGGFPPNLPPQMQRGQRPSPPWRLMQQLWFTYGRDNVQTVDMAADSISDDIDLLLVIHPKDISEKAQFAIDQYVLKGGKVAAFLDPNHAFDQGPMGGFAPPTGSSSNLDKLLPAWGLNFNGGQVVVDPTYGLRPPRSGSSWVTALDIQREGLNENDPITQNLGPVSGVHFGAFRQETSVEDNAVRPTMTTLIHSTTNSALVSASKTTGLFPVPSFQQSQADLLSDFVPTAGTNILALKLTGKFATAFPDGDPERPAVNPDDNATTPPPPDTSLKSVKADVNPVVVLVSDADFLHNTINELDQLRGFRNSNLNFVLNLVDYLTGDEDLIRIRSLTNRSRPLKKLTELEEQATRDIQKELEQHEKDLEEADQKVAEVTDKLQNQLRNAIQSGQSGVIRLQVSEQDQKKLEESQAEAEDARDRARKAIRRIKKERRIAIDSLRNQFKWASIACMPFLVAVFGAAVSIRNRK